RLRRLQVEPGLAPAELGGERGADADEGGGGPAPEADPGDELEGAEDEEAPGRGGQRADAAVEEVEGDPVAEGVEDGDHPPELQDDRQEDDQHEERHADEGAR